MLESTQTRQSATMSEDFETLSAAWADIPGPLTPPSLSLTPSERDLTSSERDLTSSLLSQESFGEIMSIADAARLQQRVCELEAREMARQRQTLLLLFRTEVAEAKADAAAGRPNATDSSYVVRSEASYQSVLVVGALRTLLRFQVSRTIMEIVGAKFTMRTSSASQMLLPVSFLCPRPMNHSVRRKVRPSLTV